MHTRIFHLWNKQKENFFNYEIFIQARRFFLSTPNDFMKNISLLEFSLRQRQFIVIRKQKAEANEYQTIVNWNIVR